MRMTRVGVLTFPAGRPVQAHGFEFALEGGDQRTEDHAPGVMWRWALAQSGYTSAERARLEDELAMASEKETADNDKYTLRRQQAGLE